MIVSKKQNDGVQYELIQKRTFDFKQVEEVFIKILTIVLKNYTKYLSHIVYLL